MSGHASLPPRQPRRTPSSTGSSTPARRSSPARKRKPKRTGPPVAMLLGGAVAAVAVIVGGIVAFQSLGSAVGLRVSSADLGLSDLVGDSPKAILGDFLDVVDDLNSTVVAVKDAESAQKAVAKVQKLEWQLVELQRRAVLVDPVPQDEMKAIEESLGKPTSFESFQYESERLKNAGLANGELAEVMRSLAFQMQSTIHVLEHGMVQLPEPKNESETLARDYVELGREQARIVARIKSADDLQTAIKDSEALILEFEALAARKAEYGRKSLAALESAKARYTPYDTHGVVQALDPVITDFLGPSPEMADVQAEIATARSEYEFALLSGASVAAHVDGRWEEFAQPAPPKAGNLPRADRPTEPAATLSPPEASPGQDGFHRPAMSPRPGGFPGPDNFARPGDFGPPHRPDGAPAPQRPGPPDFLPDPRRGAPTPAGPDQLIVILRGGPFVSARGLDGDALTTAKERQTDAQKEYGARLISLAGSNSLNSAIAGGISRNTLAYTGDIQELADKIDFGTVAEVNAESRTIVIELPEVDSTP